jgi:antitoxin MazE
MKVLVKKWGNSAAVRLPASIVAAAPINLDQPVDVREEVGRIIIEKLPQPAPDIDALIERITPENRHGEADFGAQAGLESW